MVGRILAGKLTGIPITLADVVDYQSDTIVSREIVRKRSGTITAFAFDRGQGLSEHTAPFDATVFIIDGQAQVNISGRSHVVKKGQMIIMPAAKPHSLKALKRFKMMLIMVKV